MKVFNLTGGNVDFRGKTLTAFGSADFPDMKFVFQRDMDLQKAGILSFGSLPKGWKRPQPLAEPSPLVQAVKNAAEAPKVLIVIEEKVTVANVAEVLLAPLQEETPKEKKDDTKKWKK